MAYGGSNSNIGGKHRNSALIARKHLNSKRVAINVAWREKRQHHRNGGSNDSGIGGMRGGSMAKYESGGVALYRAAIRRASRGE